MKTGLLSLAFVVGVVSLAHGQAQQIPESVPITSTPAPVPGTTAAASPDQTLDPAKVAEYQRRFQQGYNLEQAGKLTEALAVYDGILAEQPTARRSLLEAGNVSLKLGQTEKANDYFTKLHTLEPEYPAAIVALIQINETLKHDVKVAILLKQFRELHASGKNPEFSNTPNFVREKIPLSADETFIMTEFFDYKSDPNVVWIGERQDNQGKIKRQFMLRYDPDATKDIRAKDPKLANTEEFLLVDDVIQNEHIVRIDVYKQLFALPEYDKTRNTMLAIMVGAMKPIYSQNITAPAGQ